MEIIANKTGIKVGHVVYRASNQIMQDMIGGQIKIACDNAATALPQVRDGKLRAIAVTSLKRYSELPDVPTVAETLPAFDILTWHAYIAASTLPRAITDRLTVELVAIAKESDVVRKLKDLGVEPSNIAGAEFEAFVRQQSDYNKGVIEAAGIKIPMVHMQPNMPSQPTTCSAGIWTTQPHTLLTCRIQTHTPVPYRQAGLTRLRTL